MMAEESLKTHIWAADEPREIHIEGRSIFHHRCRRCGRDFARESSTLGRKAVYIGAFSVKFLGDSVNQKWLSDPCPGSLTPSPDATNQTGQGELNNRNRPPSCYVQSLIEPGFKAVVPPTTVADCEVVRAVDSSGLVRPSPRRTCISATHPNR
jgi:hypothetical protein